MTTPPYGRIKSRYIYLINMFLNFCMICLSPMKRGKIYDKGTDGGGGIFVKGTYKGRSVIRHSQLGEGGIHQNDRCIVVGIS